MPRKLLLTFIFFLPLCIIPTSLAWFIESIDDRVRQFRAERSERSERRRLED